MNKIFNDPTNINFVGFRRFLKLEFLTELLQNNLIVDGVQGGLILGNFHSEGGIPIIQDSRKNEYEILFEAEGYEFLMNPLLTSEELIIVEKINKTHLTKEINKYVPPHNVKVLNAHGDAVLLWGKGAQFVVNKNATKQNLEFLDNLNKTTWIDRANK